jgi:hypothetical protein
MLTNLPRSAKDIIYGLSVNAVIAISITLFTCVLWPWIITLNYPIDLNYRVIEWLALPLILFLSFLVFILGCILVAIQIASRHKYYLGVPIILLLLLVIEYLFTKEIDITWIIIIYIYLPIIFFYSILEFTYFLNKVISMNNAQWRKHYIFPILIGITLILSFPLVRIVGLWNDDFNNLSIVNQYIIDNKLGNYKITEFRGGEGQVWFEKIILADGKPMICEIKYFSFEGCE